MGFDKYGRAVIPMTYSIDPALWKKFEEVNQRLLQLLRDEVPAIHNKDLA